MRIAVDLTPVLPGGQNGGLKPLVLGLLRDLIALAPDIEFALLTSYATDAELAALDGDNVSRRYVENALQPPQKADPGAHGHIALRRRVRFALTRMLPPRLMLAIERVYLAVTGQHPKPPGLPNGLDANLLFNPFTTSSFHEPGLPSISLVHDVQFLQYPRFFRPEQRASRRRDLQYAARLSDCLVCTSAFVERMILKDHEIPSTRLVTIQPRAARRLAAPRPEEGERVLTRLGVTRDGFLLYPGNFWPHKNHGMLLTAFGLFRERHPESSLTLVCPGEQGAWFDELLRTTRAMQLEDWVKYPGYISDTELAALYQACRAVIFPSLDEGVGLPVMEALAFEKPVLCGAYASLQAVAGDTAVYFNPRLLSDIAEAIELAGQDPELLHRLVPAGTTRRAAAHDSTLPARDYLRLFREVAI